MASDKKVTIIQPEKKRNQRLRVAGYARVSSDSEDQLHSFQSQIDYFYHKIENDKKKNLDEELTKELETLMRENEGIFDFNIEDFVIETSSNESEL